MSQTTNVKQVKMNIMTQQQYTQATKDPTELYMVTDAELYDAFTGADGTNAGTSGLVPAPAATDNTKYLKGDGTWGVVDALPSQTSQSGKFLTTNGTSASWANVPTEIPTQTGNSGKFLTTNGSTASWAAVDALPSQTSQSGKYLTTNGTTASWASISVPTKISDLTDDTSTYPIDKADTLTGLTATITELNYVDGVTSAIQTQLNGKQDSTTAVTHTASTAAGSGTQPVYIASDGTATATTYSLAKSVPADAVFTDTTYSAFTGATGSAAGTSGLVPAPAATDNTKYLKGDGTWGVVDALPSQTSQSGKFLTTDGTTASWAAVDTLPSQTSQSGKYLTTDGTTASWASISVPTKISDLTDDTSTYPVDQADSVTNQNSGGSAIKTWTGTRAQYDAIATKDANTLYNITDDTDVTLTLLNALYPVGAIYIGTCANCPLQVLGVGTWQLVAQDRVLQGAGTRGSVGSTINESLPNITGTSPSNANWLASSTDSSTGAFYRNDIKQGKSVDGQNTQIYSTEINFDASRSNSTYQDDAPVQQDAYIVNIWERVA